MSQRNVFAVLAVSLLLGLSPLAADPLIQHGIDVFTTPADGRTFYDFAQKPIPAGFFCESSKAFTGRVALKGLPLATETSGQLLGGDTVIERLDDATFNAKGIATTRLQFRALSLVSVDPIKTSCGAFHVYVSLAGKQRATAMKIHRTREDGGSFVAPLAVKARITFIPVKPAKAKGPRKLELTASLTFLPRPIAWSLASSAKRKPVGSVVVDTNGDLAPDTLFSGTSNFAPGRSVIDFNRIQDGGIGGCCEECHAAEGHEHCYYPYGCYPMFCGPGGGPPA